MDGGESYHKVRMHICFLFDATMFTIFSYEYFHVRIRLKNRNKMENCSQNKKIALIPTSYCGCHNDVGEWLRAKNKKQFEKDSIINGFVVNSLKCNIINLIFSRQIASKSFRIKIFFVLLKKIIWK